VLSAGQLVFLLRLSCTGSHANSYISGADGLLKVGGAQAIGAFAYGAGAVPICDAIVGPGNKFVTAAKSLVAGAVSMPVSHLLRFCIVVIRTLVMGTDGVLSVCRWQSICLLDPASVL
jgi:hypothetical protein